MPQVALFQFNIESVRRFYEQTFIYANAYGLTHYAATEGFSQWLKHALLKIALRESTNNIIPATLHSQLFTYDPPDLPVDAAIALEAQLAFIVDKETLAAMIACSYEVSVMGNHLIIGIYRSR